MRPVSVTLRSGAPPVEVSLVAPGAPGSRPARIRGRDVDRVDEDQAFQVLEPVQVVEHLEEAAVDLDREGDRAVRAPAGGVAVGGDGAIESQSMPAAAAMSFACRMNSPRSGLAGIAARSVRRLACCCGALRLSSFSCRIVFSSSCFWLCARDDLVARVVEVARRRREEQEVPEQDEDDATRDEPMSMVRFTGCSASASGAGPSAPRW